MSLSAQSCWRWRRLRPLQPCPALAAAGIWMLSAVLRCGPHAAVGCCVVAPVVVRVVDWTVQARRERVLCCYCHLRSWTYHDYDVGCATMSLDCVEQGGVATIGSSSKINRFRDPGKGQCPSGSLISLY